jgi:hypothetical protein
LIKPLLDPVVASKIVFAKGPEILQYLPAQYVPKRLGGTDTYEFVYPEPDMSAPAKDSEEARAAWEDSVAAVEEATWKCIQAWKTPDDTAAIKAAEEERDKAKAVMVGASKKMRATTGHPCFLHNSGVICRETGAIDWSKQK